MPTTGDTSRSGYEHFDHGADIGVRGFGPTMATAFAEAARALAAIVADPAAVAVEETIGIDCTAPAADVLLVDFLNEVVYAIATRGMVFARFDVAITDGRLHAVGHGQRLDANRHALGVEVKGATWTELRVDQDADGTWVAQCVVDV